ncbi:hypothetical protein [Aliarcobacter cryaerophilus]|uniref:hypothetical protein n=1 Tax=Aliarcobacter cryaerophilus TaxID=28198 RepID=UPI003DA2B69E
MQKLEEFIAEYIKNNFEKKRQSLLDYLIEKRNNWLNDNVIKKIDSLEEKLFAIDKIFYKDVYLKFILNEMLNQKDDKKIHKWIVEDWGGIKTHKDFETLIDSMNKNSFDRISSWSKIASFKDLSEYVIYDSRVIYSLNWLIYRFNKQYKKTEKYFFQPSGRNKLLTLLPVDSIINFGNIERLEVHSKGDNIFGDIYFQKSECYSKLCEFIKNLNKFIFKDIEIQIKDMKIQAENYPFFTEMLLFQIADDIIFDDIKDSISINVKEIKI